MSAQDIPSGSGSAPPSTKAIGSLAKKQGDVTRQGTQKLKFVPTLPSRRKKEDVKTEPVAQSLSETLASSRGRSRGRGEARGRGRGRGAPRPDMEMTASGPFAMGPALAGNNARRSVPRSNFAPVMPPSGPGSAVGSNLTHTVAPSLQRDMGHKDKGRGTEKSKEDEEVYSDPDEGVEIIDMGDVRKMDWMAPESLRREHHAKKFKKEEISSDSGGGTNHANALDLSESEEEEELEDIIEHFTNQSDADQDSLQEERLYFFQFPSPFPTFVSPTSPDPNVPIDESVSASVRDAKSEPGTAKKADGPKEEDTSEIDGIIGQLEIYRSGAVKMRLANGILLDVTAATQPSFLQQAVYLSLPEKQLSVLGEVNKRFSVSPNVEALLTAMEAADRVPMTVLDSEALIQIDMS